MGIKLSAFAPIISSLFSDKVDIYRYTKVLNDDGTSQMVLPEEPLYKDVACRLSLWAADPAKDWRVDETPVRYSPKIMCGANVDLRAGDWIAVNRMQDDGTVLRMFKGRVNFTNPYPTHQEGLLLVDESA